MTGFLLRVAGLTSIYLLVLASRDWRDALLGAALSAAMLLVTRTFRRSGRPATGPAPAGRALWFVPFALAALADIVKGSLEVAACIAGLRTVRHAGIVRVPYGGRSPRGVAVSGVVLTLAPGSVLVDLDDERREMIVHAIDASDPQAVIDGIQGFYERWQRRVFP